MQIKCVNKAETLFNILLNNHRSNVSDSNGIPAYFHFTQEHHNFHTHTKFTFIETITNRIKSIEVIQDILRKREKFWINTLEILHQHGLNQKLNLIQLYSRLGSFTCTQLFIHSFNARWKKKLPQNKSHYKKMKTNLMPIFYVTNLYLQKSKSFLGDGQW